jgi:predicted aspartyl protease
MKKYLPLLLLFFLAGCSVKHLIKKGKVASKDFYYKTSFDTIKSMPLIPAKLNGTSKNFLFDTGAQLSVIQRDSITGKIFTVRGASNRTVESGSETIKSFKIGDVDFVNTFANNSDLVGLKEKIPNFGGIIGQPIIKKANWLIDFPNKTLEVSSRDLSDNTFEEIFIENSIGAAYSYLTINGKKFRVIIDLGSSSMINAPQDSELAVHLMNEFELEENTRNRYTVGGSQVITEQIGVVNSCELGNIPFENIDFNINQSSQPRVGMPFFKNRALFIDNDKGRYLVKK